MFCGVDMMYKALLVAVVLFAFIDLSLSQCGDIAPDNYKQWTWLLGSNLFNISVSSGKLLCQLFFFFFF